MVLTIHRGGAPQNTLQALSVPVNNRKEALNPSREIEGSHARLMGKSNPVLNMKYEIYIGKVEEISETFKRHCVDICCLQ